MTFRVLPSQISPTERCTRVAATSLPAPPVGDAAADVGSGVSVDAGSIVSVDTGSGVCVDTGSIVSVDTGSGVCVDTGSTVSVDTGSGVCVDTGSIVSVDTGSTVCVDTGSGVSVGTAASVSVDVRTGTCGDWRRGNGSMSGAIAGSDSPVNAVLPAMDCLRGSAGNVGSSDRATRLSSLMVTGRRSALNPGPVFTFNAAAAALWASTLDNREDPPPSSGERFHAGALNDTAAALVDESAAGAPDVCSSSERVSRNL